MLIFQREIKEKILEKLFQERIIIIFGPRQSGKTTLSRTILDAFGDDGIYLNCELVDVRECLVPGNPKKLYERIGLKKKVAVLDEAQTIENIGLILKNFVDTYPQVQIIATGSSSFDLANKIKEPLTGRSYEFM